jgi:hypothetical protein
MYWRTYLRRMKTCKASEYGVAWSRSEVLLYGVEGKFEDGRRKSVQFVVSEHPQLAVSLLQ